MKKDEMRIEYVPLTDIKRWPRNPKLHRADVIDGSIKRFGFVNPFLRDETTGRLVAGHGRLETLEKMLAAGEPAPKRVKVGPDGEWLVPVTFGIAFDNEAEAEAYVVTDNKSSEAGWDDKLLAEIFADRGADTFKTLGWDQAGIDSVLQSAAASEATVFLDDLAAQPEAAPVTDAVSEKTSDGYMRITFTLTPTQDQTLQAALTAAKKKGKRTNVEGLMLMCEGLLEET